ncbi:MAG: TAXI family TRAP transporter solute-binding subunit [Lachnospiraceae bacterium]|jgi:TRAP transporter TAXI family solute receptor|nr:TAXI family TRAP transporter solute-binding subunit [Lachnospiraceae bacterium]
MKKFVFLPLTLAAAMALTACSKGASSTPSQAVTAAGAAATTAEAASSDSQQTAEETYDLVWAGTSSSSGYYALNVAVCDIINTYVDGVTVTLMETGGTVDDYKLMMNKEASFGQTSNVNEYCLQQGIATYEGFGYTGGRDLCFFVPQVHNFVVSSDSGIRTLSDLAGKKFNAGLSGSSTEIECMNMLNTIGIKPNWYPASTADAIDAVSNRQITGLVKTGTTLGTDSTITNLQSSVEIEFLSFTEEEIAKVQEVYPYYNFKTVSCADYGKDYEVNSLGMNLGFCVSEELPEDVVYRIIKAIDEHMDAIRTAYPGIADDPLALTNEEGTLSLLHPGVVKYMQEKGMTVDPARIPQ